MSVIQLRRRTPYAYDETERPQAPKPTHLRASRGQQPRRADRITEQDEELLDSLASQRQRQQRQPGHTEQLRIGGQDYRQQPRGGMHPLFYVGLTMLVLWLVWVATTAGASWVTTHFIDPGHFGPTHGNIVAGVFGGGDSAAQPSKLIGWNDSGHVEVIMLHADDVNHAHIYPGPNLTALGFPDPTGAEIQLETGHFPDPNGNRDSNLDLRIRVLSTAYDWPLHRYEQDYTLYGDGKGGLTSQPPSASSGNGGK